MQNLAEKILFLRGLNSEKFECSQLVQNLSATNLFKVSLFKAHLVLSNAPGDSPPPDLSKGQISNPCFYLVRLPTHPQQEQRLELTLLLDEMPPLPERCNRPHFYIFPSSPLTQVSLFRFCKILLSSFSLAQTLLNCDLDQHSKGLLLRTYRLFSKSWDEAGTQLRSAKQPLGGIR